MVLLTELEVKHCDPIWNMKQLAMITNEALYRFDLFKSKKEPAPKLQEIVVSLPSKNQTAAATAALQQGNATGIGMQLAKNLANLPSNICTPTFLAEQARTLAKEHASISLDILDEKKMRQLKMGALLAVAQGSAEAANMICMRYQGAAKKQAPIVLIGKGITFDTGGNSIKPADSMVSMKHDMTGGASVFGTLKACALLKLPINVVGIVPAVENMPGGTAYKPDDILTSMSGQTIEVISTDAEGRLILADALTYCSRYQPDVVIDIATLTGAVVIALGVQTTGLWTNSDPLGEELLRAGKESNDRAWLMPLFEDYQDQLKSPVADMANVGGRSAGAITAACFLARFAKDYRWAHLDIAGTAGMSLPDRMNTGRPVPMLVQYLINRSSNLR